MMMNCFEIFKTIHHHSGCEKVNLSLNSSYIFSITGLQIILKEFESKQILSSDTEIKLHGSDDHDKFLEKAEKFFIIHKK